LHSAITHKVTEIGRMTIRNTGTGTADRGDYAVVVEALGREPTSNRRIRRGQVLGYPRLTANVWSLVASALASLTPGTVSK
jgi:hypothetical protein